MKAHSLVALIVLCCISCAAIQERLAVRECTFALVSVKPHDFTFNNVQVDFKIEGKNPNKVDAVIDKFTYTFFVNNTDVFAGTTGKGITIPKQGATDFVTSILLDYSKLSQTIIEVLKTQQASYTVKARAYISTILGEISYPVEITLD
ncbi:MAG: LEA type 2 family protein [candidate division WOR-3 bacterium]|nr:MAG: LEA type 2 family protein [candidate division WOR-3 bacterium]